MKYTENLVQQSSIKGKEIVPNRSRLRVTKVGTNYPEYSTSSSTQYQCCLFSPFVDDEIEIEFLVLEPESAEALISIVSPGLLAESVIYRLHFLYSRQISIEKSIVGWFHTVFRSKLAGSPGGGVTTKCHEKKASTSSGGLIDRALVWKKARTTKDGEISNTDTKKVANKITYYRKSLEGMIHREGFEGCVNMSHRVNNSTLQERNERRSVKKKIMLKSERE
uniref:Uncharacterized protein n=1 Tax=Cucumis melo TaxID=3656 RepID=A0A9I9EG99_CUCME